jgi:hypothetical protein
VKKTVEREEGQCKKRINKAVFMKRREFIPVDSKSTTRHFQLLFQQSNVFGSVKRLVLQENQVHLFHFYIIIIIIKEMLEMME